MRRNRKDTHSFANLRALSVSLWNHTARACSAAVRWPGWKRMARATCRCFALPVWRRLFVLPAWLWMPAVLCAALALVWTFAAGMDETLPGYLSFAASAWALVVCCVNLPRLLRGWRETPLVQKAGALPLVQNYRADPIFRSEIALWSALAVNLFYAGVKLVSGLVYRSEWFISLSVYYLLLALMRFFLAKQGLRGTDDLPAQWRKYRLCGAVLLLMNQALAVVVALVVNRDNGFAYPGTLIYVMAGYTFYAVAVAARSSFQTRMHSSPVMTSVKTIQLVSALVSVLSLETAMLAQFGDPSEALFRRIVTAATGGAVCMIVLAMAVYMLVRGTKELRRR